jgi:hypothetical protein
MSEKKTTTSNLQIFLGALVIIGGIAAIYYWTFTRPDHEMVMDKSGYFQERDNTGLLPIMKIAMIILPIWFVYYCIKQYRRDKKKNNPNNNMFFRKGFKPKDYLGVLILQIIFLLIAMKACN